MRIVFLAVFVVPFLGACASTSPYVTRSTASPAEVPALLQGSPFIRAFTRVEQRRIPEEIEVYYKAVPEKAWQVLGVSKKLFLMEPPGRPEAPFDEVAVVVVYKRGVEDNGAMQELRAIASELGGDGLVDVQRRPLFSQLTEYSPMTAVQYYAEVFRYR